MRRRDVWSPAPPLTLRAEDAEDLSVLSACLQDALVPLGDMAFLPDEQRFVVVANRFRWEVGPDGSRDRFERVLCGVSFENVGAVRQRGIKDRSAAGFLNLLAIEFEAPPATELGVQPVLLTFSGDAAIRLECRGFLCHLEDVGEPWPTSWRPEHPPDER